MENLRTVTDEDFDEVVLKSDQPCLVDFWAPWCGPCKALEPTIKELADKFEGEVEFFKLNVDESPATPSKFGIRAIPTVLMIKGGEVVNHVTGVHNKKQLDDLLYKFILS